MKHKKKLIALMRFKQEKIDECNKDNIDIPRYFTKQDEQSIMDWPEERCMIVWGKIDYYVFYDKLAADNLDSEVCPYCVYHNNKCGECEYGSNHKICTDDDSDFYSIKINTNVIIKNKEYQQAIEKINKEIV